MRGHDEYLRRNALFGSVGTFVTCGNDLPIAADLQPMHDRLRQQSRAVLPISQLDGGHILYAALPRWHRRVALGFWVLIVALGSLWRGWLLWGVLVLALSRGRLGHPPVLDAHRPLPRSRRALAWAALVLFLLTFAPVPFKI